MAQFLLGEVSIKKKSERIAYHLDNTAGFNQLNQTNLIKACRQLKEDDVIDFDNSEIIKPEEKKMEHLAKLRDGSTGKIENGYHTANVVSVRINDRKNNDIKINPMYSYVYAIDAEMESSNDIKCNLVNDTTIYSGNKGKFTFDRGNDDRKLILLLVENENDFVMRSMGKRDLIIDDQKFSFIEAAKQVKLKYEYKYLVKGKKVYYGVKKVKIIVDPYITKNPKTVEVWLIVARFGKKGGFFYFFANFKNTDMALSYLGEKVIDIYGLRWKIEEFFRQVKQDYSWEKIQLLKYQRIQSLNLWLLILMCFIYSCKMIFICGVKGYNHFLFDFKSDKTMAEKFCYYRISLVVKLIFLSIKRRNEKPYKRNLKSKNQIPLFDFLEPQC